MTATATEWVHVPLSPTKAYTRRRALWRAGPTADSPRLGTVRITLDKVGGGSESAQYGIDETDPTMPGVRVFVLRRDDRSDPSRDLRECVVGERFGARADSCTCEAGRARLGCRHIDFLRALIERQLL